MENFIISLKMAFIYTIEYTLLLLFFGMIFNFVEKKNSGSIYRTFGRKGILVTGIVGTVIHEFSHMIFCVIFRHEITEFSLFRPFKSRYDGIMGYVNHRCDLNNPYQRVGNFFIAIAPIIIGTLFLMLCMWFLLPNEFSAIYGIFKNNMLNMNNINNLLDSFNIYVNIVLAIISNLNPFKNHNFFQYILYIYIMYSVTTHMDLSREDLKNSTSGLLLFLLLLYIINFIFIYLGFSYQIILMRVLISIFSFLTVAMLFALITMTISILVENLI